MTPEILYEDRDMIVVYKPAGMESQSGRSFSVDLSSYLKNRLAAQGIKNPYIGVVHRLDRMVAGVMVYAKTKEAAAALSRQVQSGQMKKYYKALLWGRLVHPEGELTDYLLQDGKANYSSVVQADVPGAKEARLAYRQIPKEDLGCVLKQLPAGAVSKLRFVQAGETETAQEETVVTGVEIHLLTGRHHQIRVQFAHLGTPLWGDTKYNPAFHGVRTAGVALCAWRLVFHHPRTGKPIEFCLS